MNQSINTDSKNSKEPQQKYRLGTVSIKILGGLNRFYGRPTSPLECSVLNNAKSFSGMVYCYVGLSGYANKVVRLLISLKKNDKN